jgi:hypothetical protein
MELRLRVTRKRVALVVAAFALVAAGAAIGVTSNAYTDANGVYTGCVDKTSGILRVLTPTGQTCRNSEVAIDWNQVGPQGPQGIQGPKGDTGATGATGPEGPAGPTGADGEDGADGAPGAAGADGEDGVSVTSETLAAGDTNCANGGSKFTAANGITYACNGADGQDGEDGQDGATGPPGEGTSIAGWEIVSRSQTLVGTFGTFATAQVDCPSGKRPLGGGGTLEENASFKLISSSPVSPSVASPNGGWSIRYYIQAPPVAGWPVHVYAICASTG